MIQVSNIKMPLDFGLDNNPDALYAAVCKKLGVKREKVQQVQMLRRAVDARKKSNVHFVITANAWLSDDLSETSVCKDNKDAKVVEPAISPIPKVGSQPCARFTARPIVVGAGPAGLFAALVLARAGANPIVVERGADVDARAKAISSFSKTGVLNERTNVQFGEGGAGTYSDGKLNTGLSNPAIRAVLQTFVSHGAPEEILWSATPHIGTDLLPGIIKNLRQHIIACGATFMFNTKFVGYGAQGGKLEEVRLQLEDGSEQALSCNHLVLAIGHSARDTYEMLHTSGMQMQQKPFSMGVRIEHLQSSINFAQYGKACQHPALGAANYKLSCHLPNGRSVYTFCMCPGGQVVAAASEQGRLSVNGMSTNARDGQNANSALLVNVDPSDFGGTSPLAGVELQRKWEQAAFELGGGNFVAPVQLAGDFMQGVPSSAPGNIEPTYPIGAHYTSIESALPSYISQSIKLALPVFAKRIAGFDTPDAVLTAIESRSSSPVRIPRNEECCSSVAGVYPCGEGAGYAGGITSSAVDGIRCAQAILRAAY